MDESLSKSSYHSYEVYEEECVETLSDDDNQHFLEFPHHNNNNPTQYVEVEVMVGDDDVDEVEYVEEEILESTFHTLSLPGISEGDNENDDREDDDDDDEVEEEVVLTDNDDDDEYDEVEVLMNGSQSILSGSEVEIVETDDDDDDYDDGPDSTAYEEEVLIEEYYDDDENDEHDEIEVIHPDHDHDHHEKIISTTTRRVSDESQNDDRLEQSFRKNRSLSGWSNFNHNNDNNNNHKAKSSFRTTTTDDDDELVEVENDDNDGASAEELTEAIEYVLRQERAVSKFILTDEQAQKMAHLPIPVMKIIVDHLEICDNEAQPIDWDFLLKIVCPYCDE